MLELHGTLEQNEQANLDVSMSLSNIAAQTQIANGTKVSQDDNPRSNIGFNSESGISPIVRKKVTISQNERFSSQSSSMEKDRNETVELEQAELLYTNREEMI